MHLLDTNTLTHLYAGHPQVIAHLQTVDDPLIGTTIIWRTLRHSGAGVVTMQRGVILPALRSVRMTWRGTKVS